MINTWFLNWKIKKMCYVISIQVLQHLKHKIYINYTHTYDLWMNPNFKNLKIEGESSLKFKVWTYRLASMVTSWINELKIIKALDLKHLLQDFFSTTNTRFHKLNKEHWKSTSTTITTSLQNWRQEVHKKNRRSMFISKKRG